MSFNLNLRALKGSVPKTISVFGTALIRMPFIRIMKAPFHNRPFCCSYDQKTKGKNGNTPVSINTADPYSIRPAEPG
jgi:hypothetical protein